MKGNTIDKRCTDILLNCDLEWIADDLAKYDEEGSEALTFFTGFVNYLKEIKKEVNNTGINITINEMIRGYQSLYYSFLQHDHDGKDRRITIQLFLLMLRQLIILRSGGTDHE